MTRSTLDGFDLDVFESSPFDERPEPIDVTPPRPEGVVLRPAAKPAEPEPTPAAEAFGQPTELPHALIYPSKDGGTGNGHVVIRQANGEWTCICWPALRLLPRGCHAMVAARALVGDPPIE